MYKTPLHRISDGNLLWSSVLVLLVQREKVEWGHEHGWPWGASLRYKIYGARRLGHPSVQY
jgi:hypothetical protein